MPQRSKVVSALRFINKNPKVPEKGIKYIGRKLQETEEEPGQTQKYLKSAYQYLQRQSKGSPILKNIRRLSTAIGKPGR
jgi:hypothetical protein